MRMLLRTVALALALAALSAPAAGAGSAGPSCPASPVHYTPYPGGAPGLGRLPWIAGGPSKLGLVGLLWYWPADWKTAGVATARIYTGGTAPGRAMSTKILWAFVGPAKRAAEGSMLVVRGERLDAPGKTWQQFVPISYEGQKGSPSFASIVNLPQEGCWRVHLSAGRARTSVVFQAVSS